MNKFHLRPMRFAHRGLVQAAPENTLEAFIAAVDFGCEGVEIDITLSGDGEIIVVHDDDFSRMTDGVHNGIIAQMNTKDILSVELPFAGHLLPFDPPVPYSEQKGSCPNYTKKQIEEFRKTDKRVTHLITFEQFDKWFTTVTENVVIEIELKSNGMLPRLWEILRKSSNVDRYILFSGRESINREIQEQYRKNIIEDLRLGANIRVLNNETLKFIKNSTLFEVGLNDQKYNREDVKFLNSMGIEVFSNLGDYESYWKDLQTLGVLGFKTNYAQSYTQWLSRK